ncbi:DUF1760-domain-containing protein [Patellaria atrata CBS 101060]|uniref:DUF1760-domain-containing protein n=1 Tax=Patellaria atrata CBS 101060 TaxID=1346257 RepID=A0A9P4S9K1_9PEZI|nr:DUF1760-domain-containing protein [Patellaria atrata CBS 101060]
MTSMTELIKDPLLEALPPATDYLTYLTLIEYNLTHESLPILHKVLQDEELTVNIGWDLVHLLLPFLPESEACLNDIARLGNPREVVLKVTEALRFIDEDDDETKFDVEDEEPEEKPQDEKEHGDGSRSKQPEIESKLPASVLKFKALLSMLSILHPRIKTKYPSRFLSTSLQAVLVCYARSGIHTEERTAAIIKLIKTLTGTQRPHLPPRKSSGNLLTATKPRAAPDPEASSEAPSADEAALQRRLFQSLITHVMEEYMNSLSSTDDVTGLSWSSRLLEKINPSKNVPGRQTLGERFTEDEELQGRGSAVGQILALARDLEIKSSDLFDAIINSHIESTTTGAEEEEPPSSAEDIPLSKIGALYLITAHKVSELLYEIPRDTDTVPIFPDHAFILNTFLPNASAVSIEPDALVDTLLALGLIALEMNDVGTPEDDEQFLQYLQTICLISANSPSPSIRYNAHYLASTVLRSHPSDVVRLSFIRDTLEHAPYENLKASAVGWLKGETIEANITTLQKAQRSGHRYDHAGAEEEHTVFSTPLALSTVSPFIFPSLVTPFSTAAPLSESWVYLKTNISFYLTALNFYYLLLTAVPLHQVLDIPALHKDADVGGSFLGPLKEAVGKFSKALKEGGELFDEEGEEGAQWGLGEVGVLEDVIGRVEEGVRRLNLEG